MLIWAINKIKENPTKFQSTKVKEYKDGEVLKIGEEKYILKIDFKDKQSSSASIIGEQIYLNISGNLSKEKQNEHISTLLSRLIGSKRLPILKNKIDDLNKKLFNVEVKKIFFKNSQSRWGSCSNIGNINISTRLLFAPDDVLEYVCIHELAHRIEQNHSEKFWELVKKAMPNYKEKEKWLKEHGNGLGF